MVIYQKLLPRTKKRGVFYLSLKISSLNRLASYDEYPPDDGQTTTTTTTSHHTHTHGHTNRLVFFYENEICSLITKKPTKKHTQKKKITTTTTCSFSGKRG